MYDTLLNWEISLLKAFEIAIEECDDKHEQEKLRELARTHQIATNRLLQSKNKTTTKDLPDSSGFYSILSASIMEISNLTGKENMYKALLKGEENALIEYKKFQEGLLKDNFNEDLQKDSIEHNNKKEKINSNLKSFFQKIIEERLVNIKYLKELIEKYD